MNVQDKDIDKGYAWVVLVAAFCIQMISGILTYSPGVTNIAILEEVENDLTKSSWIGAALFGTFTLLGPLAGIVNNRLGSRITTILGGILVLIGMTAASFCKSITGMILTYGLITGCGICLGGNLVGVIPGEYFIKRRAAAYGITMSGGAVGLFISGPLTRYLLDQYGLSGTMLLMGAVAFHLCIAGILVRNKGPVALQTTQNNIETDAFSPEKHNECSAHYNKNCEQITFHSSICENADQEAKSPLKPLVSEANERSLKTASVDIESKLTVHTCKPHVPNCAAFIVYNINLILWSLGESACMFHLPNYSQLKGSTPTQAARLFTAMGVGGLFSRTATGMIASDVSIGYTTLHVGLTGITGILTLLFPLYSNTYPLQMTFSVLYGVYNQGVNALIAPITISFIGISNVAVGFGTACFSCGVGYFIGPPIASVIYKLSGSYDFTFIFTGVCLIASSVATATTSLFRTKNEDV